MKTKTAIWISVGIVVAGAASWLLFFRKKNTLSAKDRSDLKQFVPVGSGVAAPEEKSENGASYVATTDKWG